MELYRPQLEEMGFRETMLGDETTMAYNHAYGGTIPFPRARWAQWYDRWVANPAGKRFYRYLKIGDTFVGEVAYHLEETTGRHLADVIVHAPYRGKGYGRQGLLLLMEAAKNNGLQEIYDEIAVDNPSLALFLQCGFSQVSRGDHSVWVRKEL